MGNVQNTFETRKRSFYQCFFNLDDFTFKQDFKKNLELCYLRLILKHSYKLKLLEKIH